MRATAARLAQLAAHLRHAGELKPGEPLRAPAAAACGWQARRRGGTSAAAAAPPPPPAPTATAAAAAAERPGTAVWGFWVSVDDLQPDPAALAALEAAGTPGDVRAAAEAGGPAWRAGEVALALVRLRRLYDTVMRPERDADPGGVRAAASAAVGCLTSLLVERAAGAPAAAMGAALRALGRLPGTCDERDVAGGPLPAAVASWLEARCGAVRARGGRRPGRWGRVGPRHGRGFARP
jgi:hypothetical protein